MAILRDPWISLIPYFLMANNRNQQVENASWSTDYSRPLHYRPREPVGQLLVETHDEPKLLAFSCPPESLGNSEIFADYPIPGLVQFSMEGTMPRGAELPFAQLQNIAQEAPFGS